MTQMIGSRKTDLSLRRRVEGIRPTWGPRRGPGPVLYNYLLCTICSNVDKSEVQKVLKSTCDVVLVPQLEEGGGIQVELVLDHPDPEGSW